jgi:hypothetical protein
MSDGLINFFRRLAIVLDWLAALRITGAVMLEKPARDVNDTQSELRVGLLAGFVTLRASFLLTNGERADMDP